MLEIHELLYGLCESGDICHKNLYENHLKDLGITNFRFDPSMYCKMSNFLLIRLSGGYVNVLLRTRTPKLKTKLFYLSKKEQILLDAIFKDFRSLRNKLAWLASFHPDCLFSMSKFYQGTGV